MGAPRVSRDMFIERCNSIFNNKYDYTDLSFTTTHSKVTIRCREHGPFILQADKHLAGRGCPVCTKNNHNSNKMGIDAFVTKSISVHGNKYDYSRAEYQTSKTPVTIICNEHGPFRQTPSSHLHGSGCPICTNINIGRQLLPFSEVLKRCQEIHGDKYDYSLVDYQGMAKPVRIICKKHQKSFLQMLSNHTHRTQKQGCPLCKCDKTSARLTLTTDQFIERARRKHGDYYDYSEVKLFKSKEKSHYYMSRTWPIPSVSE